MVKKLRKIFSTIFVEVVAAAAAAIYSAIKKKYIVAFGFWRHSHKKAPLETFLFESAISAVLAGIFFANPAKVKLFCPSGACLSKHLAKRINSRK